MNRKEALDQQLAESTFQPQLLGLPLINPKYKYHHMPMYAVPIVLFPSKQ